MAYTPRLRDGVRLAPAADGKALKVEDPLFNRSLDFAGPARALLERMDGRRPLGDLFAEAAAALPDVTPDELARSFRTLLLLNLVDGAGASIVERTERVKRGEEKLPIETLPESRFQCQGSGDCCRSYLLGPIFSHDVERIQALDPERHFPRLAGEGFYVDAKTPEGAPVRFLRTIDGRCVFLENDGRCGLHARFGPESKPYVCRLFPWTRLSTIEGIKIYDEGECSQYAMSERTGETTSEQLHEILPVLPPSTQIEHPIVFLDGNQACDYGYFLKLQRRLVDLVGEGIGTALETLIACGRFARAYAAALQSCPLAPGEPEATAARALERDPRDFYSGGRAAPPASPEEVRRRCESAALFFGELLGGIGRAVSAAHNTISGNTMRLSLDLASILRALQVAAAHVADPAAHPLDEGFRSILAVPADCPDYEELFRRSFRQQLFGDRAVLRKSVPAALLRLAAMTLSTIFGAKLRARMVGADRARPEDFSFGHMRANRIFRHEGMEEVFAKSAARAWDVIEAVPAIIAAGASARG
jgi:Fe-S-cluster containining protein